MASYGELEMKRSTFAVVACLASLLLSGRALAESPCAGIVITDVIESPRGALMTVGERCYERVPGVPLYYDAPGRPVPGRPLEASMSHFEASTLEGLGFVDMSDLTNPLPAGQGREDFDPE